MLCPSFIFYHFQDGIVISYQPQQINTQVQRYPISPSVSLQQQIIQMFVSGVQIQSKKPSISRKSQLPRLEQRRPSSSELPQLPQLRSRTVNKLGSAAQAIDKIRNSSHTKILTSSKPPHRQEEPLKEYNTENRIAPRGGKPPRRSKKLELSKEGKEEECDFAAEQRLMAYFRYYPLAVLTAAGQREDLMRALNQKGDMAVVAPKGKKMPRKGVVQLWGKLTKLAMLKGKYKFREKFNFATSAQLKALAYRRKQAKKKKESSSSSSDEQPQKREKCRDMQTWKKAMGVEGSKVFVVKGKYKDLRSALLQRGWVQNQDPLSLFYDLKWTTKVNDVNFDTLKPHQIVNHFNNNACLTSKYGICKSLRSIMFNESIDVDAFFPKAFDISDLQDFQNFLELYKWTFCQSKLKKALQDPQTPPLEEQLRLKVAFVVTGRRLMGAEKIIVSLVNGRYNLCSMGEWRFLTGGKDFNMDQIQETLQQWEVLSSQWETLKGQIQGLLQRLQKKDPQVKLNGSNNIWIVKPAFLSRGRGIKCLSDLTDILDYSLGKETQYVVQKYIQNPLIINRRKFDIRQWVLVQDYAPPKIWFYGQFYCRFCLQEYNPSKLGNKYAHLTNNSIQKYNTKINVEQLQNDSMCTMEQLAAIIEGLYGPTAFKELVGKMKEIVIATILSTADQVYGRKNSFELIGYDFMIDDLLNPWLIEINSSPSMDYSTPVTRRLVKMVLEDTVKVVVDLRKKKTKKKTAGLFKCIYDAENGYEFKRYRMNEEE